eukprot:gene11967-8240_t
MLSVAAPSRPGRPMTDGPHAIKRRPAPAKPSLARPSSGAATVTRPPGHAHQHPSSAEPLIVGGTGSGGLPLSRALFPDPESTSAAAPFAVRHHLSPLDGGATQPVLSPPPRTIGLVADAAQEAGTLAGVRPPRPKGGAPPPRIPPSLHGGTGTKAAGTGDGRAVHAENTSEYKGFIRAQYRKLQKDVGEGVCSGSGLSAGGSPDIKALVQHIRRCDCPQHSEAAIKKRREEEEQKRLRLVQQQWHDLAVIENGGREKIDPSLRSSAALAASLAKAKREGGSALASSNASVALSPCTSPSKAGNRHSQEQQEQGAPDGLPPRPSSTAVTPAAVPPLDLAAAAAQGGYDSGPLTSQRGTRKEAVVVALIASESDSDDDSSASDKEHGSEPLFTMTPMPTDSSNRKSTTPACCGAALAVSANAGSAMATPRRDGTATTVPQRCLRPGSAVKVDENECCACCPCRRPAIFMEQMGITPKKDARRLSISPVVGRTNSISALSPEAEDEDPEVYGSRRLHQHPVRRRARRATTDGAAATEMNDVIVEELDMLTAYPPRRGTVPLPSRSAMQSATNENVTVPRTMSLLTACVASAAAVEDDDEILVSVNDFRRPNKSNANSCVSDKTSTGEEAPKTRQRGAELHPAMAAQAGGRKGLSPSTLSPAATAPVGFPLTGVSHSLPLSSSLAMLWRKQRLLQKDKKGSQTTTDTQQKRKKKMWETFYMRCSHHFLFRRFSFLSPSFPSLRDPAVPARKQYTQGSPTRIALLLGKLHPPFPLTQRREQISLHNFERSFRFRCSSVFQSGCGRQMPGPKNVRFQDPQHLRAAHPAEPIRNAVALSSIAQPTLEVTCRGHRGAITAVAFQRAALASSSGPPKVVSSSADGALTLWDSKITHRSLRNTAHHSPVLCCDCSPKMLAVCSGGHNGYAQLWVPNIRRTSSTYPAAWSFPAANGNDDDHFQWKAHSGAMRAVAFAQDGTDHIYTAGDDKAVKCWDVNYLHSEYGSGRLHGGGAGASNRFVGSFSTPSTSSLAGVVGHTNWIHRIAVQGPQTHSSYFHLMASGGDDRCAFLWDTRIQRCVDVLREPRDSVRGLSFHPTGYAMACADASGAIQIFDLRRVKGPLASFRSDAARRSSHSLLQMYPTAHVGAINDVVFTPDGNWLLSVGDDGNTHVWDMLEGHLYCTVQAHTGAVKACRASPDGAYFATGGYDHTVLVWRLNLPMRVAPPAPGQEGAPPLQTDRIAACHEEPMPLEITAGPDVSPVRPAVQRTPLKSPQAVPPAHRATPQGRPVSTPLEDEDEGMGPEPRRGLPPLSPAASAEPAETLGADSLFCRSEERLDSPFNRIGSGLEVGFPATGSLVQPATSGTLAALEMEQNQLRQEVRELRRLVETLSSSLEREPTADAEVQRLREDMQAMQLRQQQEFQDLRSLLTTWMSGRASSSSAALLSLYFFIYFLNFRFYQRGMGQKKKSGVRGAEEKRYAIGVILTFGLVAQDERALNKDIASPTVDTSTEILKYVARLTHHDGSSTMAYYAPALVHEDTATRQYHFHTHKIKRTIFSLVPLSLNYLRFAEEKPCWAFDSYSWFVMDRSFLLFLSSRFALWCLWHRQQRRSLYLLQLKIPQRIYLTLYLYLSLSVFALWPSFIKRIIFSGNKRNSSLFRITRRQLVHCVVEALYLLLPSLHRSNYFRHSVAMPDPRRTATRPQSTPSDSVAHNPTAEQPSKAMSSSLTDIKPSPQPSEAPPLPVRQASPADPLQFTQPAPAPRAHTHSPSPPAPAPAPARHSQGLAPEQQQPANAAPRRRSKSPAEEGSAGVPSSVFVASTTLEPREQSPAERQEEPPALPLRHLHPPAAPDMLTARTDISIPPAQRPGNPGLSDQQLHTDLDFSADDRSGLETLYSKAGPSASIPPAPVVAPLPLDTSPPEGSRHLLDDGGAAPLAFQGSVTDTQAPVPSHRGRRVLVSRRSDSRSGSPYDASRSRSRSEDEDEDEDKDSEGVERLLPLPYRPTHPADQFFVHFIEDPNNRHGQPRRDRLGDTKADCVVQPRNEEEMLLEQFAEFTDDDSFFSSGSSVISNDSVRMEEDSFRPHATCSVKDTLMLRSLRNGHGGPEDWVHEKVPEHWLFQVHHRAICLDHSSLFVFPARWTPRVVVYNILHHWAMELFIMGTILAYTIFQACWPRNPTPFLGEPFERPEYMLFADVFFTLMLGVEVLLRLFSCGLVLHPRAFLRSPWHWLDLAVLVLMCMTCSNWREMWNFTAWRLIRVIKCCRYVPVPVRLKVLAKAFLRSTTRLFSTLLFLVFFIFFFALLGLHLFKGELQYRCVDDVTSSATAQICNPKASGKYWFYWGHRCGTGYTCMHIDDGNPHFSFRSYDDIGHALLSTFQVVTFQGWTSLLTEMNDAMNTLVFLYFLFAIVVCAWVIPPLFIGVFAEKIIIVRRRFMYKQVSTMSAILNEQRQRQNAAVRLDEYVIRDEDGHVSHYPTYDKRVIEDKVEKGHHKSLADTKWTDEQRVQLHLSLTRQAQIAEKAAHPWGSQTVKRTKDAKPESNETNKGGDDCDSDYEAEEEHNDVAFGGEFVLGGKTGDVQHHKGSAGVGAAEGKTADFAKRQSDAVAAYPFLAAHKARQLNEEKRLKSEIATSKSRQEALRTASVASKVTVIPPNEHIPIQRIVKTREAPGVLPSVLAAGVHPHSDNSLLKEEDELELVVHDPEGGDFRHTATIGQRWGIVRNMVHMTTEGYPRIITHYLWEYMRMQHKYGLRPLHYTNMYEDDVIQLLRRRRLEEIRDKESRMRHTPGSAPRLPVSETGEDTGEDDTTVTLHRWDEKEEQAILKNLALMSQRIYENAPPTVFNIIMYVLIFCNGVFNASRYNTMPKYWDDALFYISVCFSVIFTLELLLHLVALGPGPFIFHGFYPLEFIFVVLSLFQLGFDRSNAISVFNWIRFLRLARVSPLLPMQQAARVLLMALPDLLIALVFFSLYMFMWLLIGMSFFGSRFADLLPADYTTRGSFDNFSYAMYAIAQAFSVNRDEWLYLSWSGMRARGGYTIMYFIATVAVAFIFRFLFIAICTSAWQLHFEHMADLTVEHMNNMLERTLLKRRALVRLRPWFDFSVWRSFKHLHGGFERRHIAPDDVYHLNADMRRYLRAAESRSQRYKELYGAPEDEVAAAAGYGKADDEVRFINVGGHLHRQYADEKDEDAAPVTLSYLSQGQLSTNDKPSSSAVPATSCEGLVADKCNDYCGDCEFHPQRDDTEVSDPNRFRHLYGSQTPGMLVPNPIHADRHSLAPSLPWRDARKRNFPAPTHSGRQQSPTTFQLGSSRGVSTASHRLAEMYPQAPGAAAQFYTLLRNPDGVEGGEESVLPKGAASPTHLLLPGPQLQASYRPLDIFQRLPDRCRDCNALKQQPLPHAPGVACRDADDLHKEHCHMAAVRNARQTVLDALLGYVEVEMEHEVKPTREMVETILGQAWSCGLLMYETMESLLDESVPVEERTWDKVLNALKLQQWITGLQVGEEQVGRAGLAYLLAHQAREDQEATVRCEQAPFKAAERPNSIWNNDKTFFFLPRENGFRRFIGQIVYTTIFEAVVLAVIFAASICLAVYTPGDDNTDMGGTYNSNKYKVLHGFDDAFTVLFVIEMLMRWVADGVVLPVGRAYCWKLWNLFDLFIVAVSLASWIDSDLHLRYLKVFRCFRLVGFARFSEWPNVYVLAHGLWTSVPTLANGCLLMLANYIIWAIVFCSMFYEKMSKCSMPGITVKTACLSQGYEWVDAYDHSFRNFYESLLTTFEISTGAEWMSVMYQAVDSWSTYAAPQSNRHKYLGLVFVAYYYVAHFILLALLTSAIIYWYVRARNALVGVEDTASPQLARWQRLRSMLSHFSPRMKLLPFSNGFSVSLHKIVTHWGFELFMAIIIVINAITMSLEWYDMDKTQQDALDALQYIFLACFTVEIIMRLCAHGTRAFTRGAFCWDVLVTVLSFVQIGLNTTTDHYVPFDVNVLRLLRVGRLLYVFCLFESPMAYARLLYGCLMAAVWDAFAVGAFFALSVLVFAVAGLHLFGYIVPYGGYLRFPYNNFHTFVNSIIMVFRLSTLENWSTMLRQSMNKGDYCSYAGHCGPTNWAPVYYIALFLCCSVLAGALFMAVIFYHYMTLSRMHRDISRWHDLFCLREAWTQLDPNATGLLPVSRLPAVLEKLRSPLGLANRFNRVEVLRLLRAYHIPVVDGDVRYDDVLQAVARRVMAIGIAEKEVGASHQKDGFEKSWQLIELQLAVFDEERNAAEKEQLAVGFHHLPTSAAKELNTFRPQRPEENLAVGAQFSAEEYFAAAYLQAAYRRDRATRRAFVERAHLWRRSRQACDTLNVPYKNYGFSRYPLDGLDPAVEGRDRGFAMDHVSTYETPRPGTDASRAAGSRVYDASEHRSPNLSSIAQPKRGSKNNERLDGLHRPSTGASSGMPPRALEPEKEYPLLPKIYKTAIQPEKKLFGPDAEGAIRRGERRSDKLAKDRAAAPHPPPPRDTSAFSAQSGDGTGRTNGSSFDVSYTSEDGDSSLLHSEEAVQPALGGDLEALRNVEKRRRARHAPDKYRDFCSVVVVVIFLFVYTYIIIVLVHPCFALGRISSLGFNGFRPREDFLFLSVECSQPNNSGRDNLTNRESRSSVEQPLVKRERERGRGVVADRLQDRELNLHCSSLCRVPTAYRVGCSPLSDATHGLP